MNGNFQWIIQITIMILKFTVIVNQGRIITVTTYRIICIIICKQERKVCKFKKVEKFTYLGVILEKKKIKVLEIIVRIVRANQKHGNLRKLMKSKCFQKGNRK